MDHARIASRIRKNVESVCANLSGFKVELLLRANMDIRALLSSIARRPRPAVESNQASEAPAVGSCDEVRDNRAVRQVYLGEDQAAPKDAQTFSADDMFFPMLNALGTRYGSQLSGGQQQMLAVAGGFMACPQLLLLDEPTEGLAPVIVEHLARSVVTMCNASGSRSRFVSLQMPAQLDPAFSIEFAPQLKRSESSLRGGTHI
jgi:ABC transporter